MTDRTYNDFQQPHPFLDRLMDPHEAAQWLKMKPRRLLAHAKGANPKIPGIWINERVVLFNPRTIITKFAHDSGMSPELVAAMFGLNQRAPAEHPGAFYHHPERAHRALELLSAIANQLHTPNENQNDTNKN